LILDIGFWIFFLALYFIPHPRIDAWTLDFEFSPYCLFYFDSLNVKPGFWNLDFGFCIPLYLVPCAFFLILHFMNFLKNIFGRIWAVWAILVFVSTMLIFLVPFLLFVYFQKEPTKTLRFIRYSRVWMAVFLTLTGCRLSIKGREKFVPGESYIVTCNHNALIDVPVTSPGIPGGNKTIAKIEMANIPVFGMIYRTGAILVDRKSEKSRRDSYGQMREVLNMGLHMCIYPEGTRNKTDQPLKSFHGGAFRLAIETGKSIMPAVLFNSRKAMPPGKKFYLLPYRLSMHFLDPIAVQPGDDADTLKQKVFECMRKYYVENA
jgi:1-acyl-sn-glycerol-3-phosphate acyltransferase